LERRTDSGEKAMVVDMEEVVGNDGEIQVRASVADSVEVARRREDEFLSKIGNFVDSATGVIASRGGKGVHRPIQEAVAGIWKELNGLRTLQASCQQLGPGGRRYGPVGPPSAPTVVAPTAELINSLFQMVQGLTEEMAVQRKTLDRLTAAVNHQTAVPKDNSEMAKDPKQRK